MPTPIDSLLTELGFEYDPRDLEKFNKGLDSSISFLKLFSKVVLGTATALFTFTTATTMSVDEQGKLSNQIGVTVGTIDALQFAARRAGGDAAGMANSLRQLTLRAGEAARGVGGGVEAFGILGITVTKTNGDIKQADELIGEISKKFEGLSKARQIELADKLGVGSSIRLLQLGEQGIIDLTKAAKELGVTNKEDAIIAEEFQDSLVDIWQIIKQISRVITRELAPMFQDMNHAFTDWWKRNKQLIGQNIPRYFESAVKWLKLLTIAAGAFLGVKIIAFLGVLGNAILLIAGLAEDATVFFEGGNSAFGELVQKFPAWKAEITTIAKVFKILADITDVIFDGWNKIFDLFDIKFDTHISALTALKDDLLDLGSTLLDNIGTNLNTFSSDLLNDIGISLNSLGDSTSSTRLSLLESKGISPESLGLGASNDTTNSIIVKEVNISVSDSGNPVATAQAVADAFGQASQNLNSSVYQ